MGTFHPKKHIFWYFLVKNIDMNNNTVQIKSVPPGKEHEN